MPRILLAPLLAAVFLFASISEAQVTCAHFWLSGTQRIASGRTIGADVGPSPFSQPANIPDGVYECETTVTLADLTSGRYLFIGEVGDASYVELQSVNGHSVSAPIWYHGLRPDSSHLRYFRYIPFFVSLRAMSSEVGVYRWDLYYKDIFPMQTGLRSGPPTVESIFGVVYRTIINSPALLFHLAQILLFLYTGAQFAALPGLTVRKRFFLSATCFGASLVILQITAIPRSFLPKHLAILGNDAIQLLVLPFVGLALQSYFAVNQLPPRPILSSRWAAIGLAPALALFLLPARSTLYFWVFLASASSMALASTLALGILILRQRAHYVGSTRNLKATAFILVGLGLAYAFDVINFAVFKSHFPYLNHFVYYSCAIVLLQRLQGLLLPQKQHFLSALDSLKTTALRILLSNDPEHKVAPLSAFAKGVCDLTGANKVSVGVIVGDRIRFEGWHGAYVKPTEPQLIQTGSIVHKCIITQTMQVGRGPNKAYPGDSDFACLPIKQGSAVVGILSLTGFRNGSLTPFLYQHLHLLEHETELLLNLLITHKKEQSQSHLLQLMRTHVHPLQLRSESHFLDTFTLSESIHGYAFIVGDLADSRYLNQRFGASKIAATIDAHLTYFWDLVSQLGVIASRGTGDFVSFVVPIQDSDVTPAAAIQRCLAVLTTLSEALPQFDAITRQHRISLPMQYRFAMSFVKTAPKTNALRSFALLSDEAIDEASRIISKVAVPNEFLIAEPAAEHLNGRSDVAELAPERLKGKDIATRIWSLRKTISTNEAA